MKRHFLCPRALSLALVIVFIHIVSSAQGTRVDYERAKGLQSLFQDATQKLPGPGNWVQGKNVFWYRRSVKGGSEMILVDAEKLTRGPAFDHEKMAAEMSAALNDKYTAATLPLTGAANFTFVDDLKAIQFVAKEARWKCDLISYKCEKIAPVPATGGFSTLPHRRSTALPAIKDPVPSPDGQWAALVRNFNLVVQSKDKKQEIALSTDGSEGDYYDPDQIIWSPDSKKIAVYRVRPGYARKIHYVESSPVEQLQPRHWTIDYPKPGDTVDVETPVVFHLDTRRQIIVDNGLFPTPYAIIRHAWRSDSRAFTFEYNQRGHLLYRVIEVDAETGTARVAVEEAPKTFFTYSSKWFRRDIDDGKEVVWMSERDGWNHLYLLDSEGKVKNQITKGEWVVRGIDRVDVEKRQIYFRAGGMYPGRDPYFNYYYRINFDGTGLKPFTEGDANHAVQFSQDMKFFVHSMSRVDLPTVSVLRSVADGQVLMELDRTDISELTKAGWKAPESFTAKGRDGTTDIWGVIVRPTNFDPKKKYPVIENIYAGPHDSHVPKSFIPYYPTMHALAEIGFIVVMIDGMGTSNRSKAFHDVAWKNLGDAGFPDRILWHKAVAAKYPYYDITRVGIYGTSAGGQSAMGALLFHPEFYKAAAASSACHDNRMDKIWWNEQWMGWPIGPHYAAASNVNNAHRLKGKLLLIVGEMDPNVDPASTTQVVNALIKANKTFEYVVFPGLGHTNGGEYGDRTRFDFFVRHLHGVAPPDWNGIAESKPK